MLPARQNGRHEATAQKPSDEHHQAPVAVPVPVPVPVPAPVASEDLYAKFIRLVNYFIEELDHLGEREQFIKEKLINYVFEIGTTRTQLTNYFADHALQRRVDISKQWTRTDIKDELLARAEKDKIYRAEMKSKKSFELNKFMQYMLKVIGELEGAVELIKQDALRDEVVSFVEIYKMPLTQSLLMKSIAHMISEFADAEIEEALTKYRAEKDKKLAETMESRSQSQRARDAAEAQSASSSPMRAISSSPGRQAADSAEAPELLRSGSDTSIKPQRPERAGLERAVKSLKSRSSKHPLKPRERTVSDSPEMAELRKRITSGEIDIASRRGRFATAGEISSSGSTAMRGSFYVSGSSASARASVYSARGKMTPARSGDSGSNPLNPPTAIAPDSRILQRQRAASHNPPPRRGPQLGATSSMPHGLLASRQRGSVPSQQALDASSPASPNSRASKLGGLMKRFTFKQGSERTPTMERRAKVMGPSRESDRQSDIFDRSESGHHEREEKEAIKDAELKDLLRSSSDSPPPKP